MDFPHRNVHRKALVATSGESLLPAKDCVPNLFLISSMSSDTDHATPSSAIRKSQFLFSDKSTVILAPHPLTTSLDSLVHAAETDPISIRESFQSTADKRPITPLEWSEGTTLYNLGSLIYRHPQFPVFDPTDITTHAVLAVTSHPGPVFVPPARSHCGAFRVELLPHPQMDPLARSSWKVSSLQITLLNESDGEPRPQQSKKRGRPPSKPRVVLMPIHSEYAFDKLEATISDLTFPASGGRSARLEFECQVYDPSRPLRRQHANFIAHSNPFMVTSNCNQWTEGFRVCLRHFVFPDGATQAPFNRFFNYLQLLYLDCKGFPEARFLDPFEIHNWLLDSSTDEHQLDRDRQLLATQQSVTLDLFDTWFGVAGQVFYDLHTTNVGKLFQKLWAAGFVGIGSVRTKPDCTYEPGHCRLTINSHPSDGSCDESYLMLHQADKCYVLRTLERDHLSYFFQHSRHSLGCTHLLSSITPGAVLPIEEVYAEKVSRLSFSSSGPLSSSKPS